MSDQPRSAAPTGPARPGPARLGLIWAQTLNGVIGNDGGMPWHLPEDLARFKAVTIGHPVVMGRRTWESLQPRFRPLAGRRNLVITRQHSWQAEGAEVAHSLEEALALALPHETWVIGGAQVYRAAIGLADRLEVTEVNGRHEGDAYAPRIDASWVAAEAEPASGWLTSRTDLEYRFRRYERAPA